jgi:hypothetical protein
MKIVSTDGSALGDVERFEIDQTGQLTHLIARTIGANGRKRIAAEQISEMRASGVVVSVSPDEYRALPDVGGRHASVILELPRARAAV